MSSFRTRILTTAVSGALAVGASVSLAAAAHATPLACNNNSLLVTNAASEGATGHGSAILLFKNTSGSTCTLYGYPGLDAIDSTGHVLAHAARTLSGFAGGPGVERTVSINPGLYASAVVEWMNFNPSTSGACTFSSAVNATPPNTSHTVRLPLKTSICGLQIHPVVGGASGLWPFAAAQSNWVAGSRVAAAVQGQYWSRAVAFLNEAGSEYATQINELKALMALPETSLTPTQIAQAHTLVSELDAFFQTPGLYV